MHNFADVQAEIVRTRTNTKDNSNNKVTIVGSQPLSTDAVCAHRCADMNIVSDAVVARVRVKRGVTISMPIALDQTMVSLIDCCILQLSYQNTGLREDTRRVGKG